MHMEIFRFSLEFGITKSIQQLGIFCAETPYIVWHMATQS